MRRRRSARGACACRQRKVGQGAAHGVVAEQFGAHVGGESLFVGHETFIARFAEQIGEQVGGVGAARLHIKAQCVVVVHSGNCCSVQNYKKTSNAILL